MYKIKFLLLTPPPWGAWVAQLSVCLWLRSWPQSSETVPQQAPCSVGSLLFCLSFTLLLCSFSLSQINKNFKNKPNKTKSSSIEPKLHSRMLALKEPRICDSEFPILSFIEEDIEEDGNRCKILIIISNTQGIFIFLQVSIHLILTSFWISSRCLDNLNLFKDALCAITLKNMVFYAECGNYNFAIKYQIFYVFQLIERNNLSCSGRKIFIGL